MDCGYRIWQITNAVLVSRGVEWYAGGRMQHIMGCRETVENNFVI